MNYSVLLYILPLAVLLLAGVRLQNADTRFEERFSIEISKGMQGYFALWIIIHQVSVSFRNAGDRGALGFFEDLGVLFVGFFFFCSGYGLITSFENKEHYLKGFLKKRVLMVLVPFFLCNYAYMITTLLLGTKYEMQDLFAAFFGLLLLNNQMWFAVEIMILYLLFYLTFRLVKNENAAIILLGLQVLVIMIISFLLGHDYTTMTGGKWFYGEWWYNTTLLFLVGMGAGRFRGKVSEILKKWYYPILVLCGVGFLLFRSLTRYQMVYGGYWTDRMKMNGEISMGYGDKAMTLICQVPMVICFVMLILLVLQKFRLHNRVMAFLGQISLEMILINRVFTDLFWGLERRWGIHIFLVLIVVFTVLAAVLLNRIKMLVLERK